MSTWTGLVAEPTFGVVLKEPLTIRVHEPEDCMTRYCAIHDPSEHHMREWTMVFRADRYFMERICPHGVGHPDPDDLTWHIGQGRKHVAVHGCDGCCSQPERTSSDDGLCHAYSEYEDMDCLKPLGHEGNHGD